MVKVNAGYDHGNNDIKMRISEKDEGFFTRPSYMVRENDFPKDVQGKVDVEFYRLQTGDGEWTSWYAWGSKEDLSKVKNSSVYKRSFAESDRYEGNPYYRLLSAFSLASIRKDKWRNETFSVVLVTGVPSNEKSGKKEKKTKEEKALKRVLENGGEPFVVEIRDFDGNVIKKTFTVKVRKITAQASAALVDQLRKWNGGVDTKKEIEILGEDRDNKNLIWDNGGATNCFDGVQGAFITVRHNAFFGLTNAFQKIADELPSNLKATKETVEMKVLKGETVYTLGQKSEPNFGKIVEDHLKNVVEDLLEELKGRDIDPEDFSNVFLVGGSTRIIGKYIKKIFPFVQIVENPEQSNVNGYYKDLMYLNYVDANKGEQ